MMGSCNCNSWRKENSSI